MVNDDLPAQTTGHRVIVALFEDSTRARAAVERLIEADFPMDRISILGRADASGDDFLGIYHDGVGKRMRHWGAQGAFWGGLWGLLASATGMFVIPGIGTLVVLGPAVEAVAAALAGATLTGGLLAGAAALTQLAVALHRMGVPAERLQAYQEAIGRGACIVLLRVESSETEQRRRELAWRGASTVEDFAYPT